MYKDSSQLRIEEYVFPYGKLDPENDWVKLAELVPWETAEERYAAKFVNNGAPAHPCRMVLGALLIQRRLKCSDVWLVKHIGENPYLQFFIGMKEYGQCPFGASTLVAFRKRFSEEDMAAILEASIPQQEKKEVRNDGGDSEPPNGGTLVLDATCCPADIAYPQDVNLLNQAREKLEKTVDEICASTGEKKPRMYRKCARRDFLRLSKNKKRSAKAIRCAIRKQLQYIRRDVGYIVRFVQNGVKLTEKQKICMNLVTTVYEQQRIMFESKTHSIPQRIVSLAQPWVRPSSGERPVPIRSSGLNCTSAWWMAMPELSGWTLRRTMNRMISGRPFTGIMTAMAAGRSVFLRIRFIETDKRWHFAGSMGYAFPVQPWAGLPRIRTCPANSKSRNIGTSVTAMWWRVFLVPARPLTAWAVFRCAWKIPPAVSLAWLCSSGTS